VLPILYASLSKTASFAYNIGSTSSWVRIEGGNPRTVSHMDWNQIFSGINPSS